MFGNNVTSSWTNPQQNQQQPAGGSAFGQPNAFGNTGGAFGSAGAFGQPQQQPQSQTNPMFGNLGGTSNTGTTPGFGAFGGANTTQANSAFGAPKPATGFGAFGGGGTSAFGGGGGGTFGSTANNNAGTTGTGLFGQPANTSTTGAFGGNNLFGNKTTGFGTGAPATNQNASMDNVPPVTTGSSTPYSAFTDKETPGNGQSVTLHYQSISCMPVYRGTSFEELRFQDYAQGRKTAGAFGQSATFGTNTTQPAAGIFGQPQQNTTTPAFGSNTTAPSAFGAFGQTNTQPAQPATSLFGGGGAFGQPQQQPASQPSAFGAFGQPAQNQQQPQQQAGGLFGNTTSAFGQPKPAGTGFAFGSGGGTFGSTNTNAFGQPQQQQQQTTSLFGQTQPAAPTNAFGAFGNNANNAATKPLFGQPAAQPAQSTFGTGLFGQNQQQNQPQQPQQQQQQPSLFGGSLFGANNNNNQQQPPQNAQQPASNLFGANTTQPSTGTGLFGGGGGLFGSNQQQQQQQTQPTANTTNAFGAGSLFGKPAAPATNLFGGFGQQNSNNTATQPQGTGLFGNTLGQSTNQQSTLGAGSLFGKPAAPAMGASMSNTGAPNGSLFGSLAPNSSFSATATAPGAQGMLTASIAEPIGNNLPIFSMLPPGPRSINLDFQPPKKKAGFFSDIPTRAPVPRVQLGYTPAASKLRGFTSSTSVSTSGNPFASVSFTSGKPGALSISRLDNKTPVLSDSLLRSQSPSLGSGQRQSVKKLILDKKVDPIDLFSKSGGSPSSRIGASKVTFSPALSVAAREKEAAAATPSSLQKGPESASRDQRSSSRLDANNSLPRNAEPAAGAQKDSAELADGDYWCKPDLDTLKRVGFQELSSFSGLVVGRKNVGEIHFLEPVDLTGLPKLGALLGDVVRFEDRECSVYPDIDDVDKPPPGSGLNVKARVTLERCWATDKATRQPIKDEKHPSSVKHLKRLRNMKDTQFEGFDIKDGKWTFIVEHF